MRRRRPRRARRRAAAIVACSSRAFHPTDPDGGPSARAGCIVQVIVPVDAGVLRRGTIHPAPRTSPSNSLGVSGTVADPPDDERSPHSRNRQRATDTPPMRERKNCTNRGRGLGHFKASLPTHLDPLALQQGSARGDRPRRSRSARGWRVTAPQLLRRHPDLEHWTAA